MNLDSILSNIHPLCDESIKKAQERLDNLSKPIGSLGVLEQIVMKISGIQNQTMPSVDRKAIVIMCADNGVVEEGVSSCPKEVTGIVTRNFTKGMTGVCVFSKLCHADLVIVDIGVDCDFVEDEIVKRKIRKGTANIAKGPAMTREEALQGINVGIEIIEGLHQKGYQLIGTGEMGIGNTTTSSAICSVLLEKDPGLVVGRGAGLTSSGLQNKIEIVRKAIAINHPDRNDPIDVLAKVGGFDIAGLVGCFIGAAYYRIPIVMDGLITYAAALIATRMHPGIREYILPSHGSAEPATKLCMDALQMEPMLQLGMRLGEGSGSAIGFQIIASAIMAYRTMGTFDDAKIEKYVPLE